MLFRAFPSTVDLCRTDIHLGSCLRLEWTQINNRTLRTLGFFGQTNAPAVILHQMAKPHPPVRGNNLDQIRFDLVGIGVARKTQALRKPHHVGVDADGLFAEGIAENDIGGLAADAGQTDQVIEIVGDLAAKALDQLTATVMNRFGFVAIKVDLADLAFQLVRRRCRRSRRRYGSS